MMKLWESPFKKKTESVQKGETIESVIQIWVNYIGLAVDEMDNI